MKRSKTSYRQAARVQHLKVTDSVAVKLIESIYWNFASDAFLFYGSPSVYRQRWNTVLSLLHVDTELRITPGGLRGGGAINEYRKGASIADIQWRMRLKNVVTLESYVQEVAALSVMTSLTDISVRKIRAASKFFHFLVH